MLETKMHNIVQPKCSEKVLAKRFKSNKIQFKAWKVGLKILEHFKITQGKVGNKTQENCC